MAGLGVAPHVADKILNHQSGAISGIAAVYQRHEFLAERKAASERWSNHVMVILSKATTEAKARPVDQGQVAAGGPRPGLGPR